MGPLNRRLAALLVLLAACGDDDPVEEVEAVAGVYAMQNVGEPTGDCDFDPVGEDQSGAWELDIDIDGAAMSAEDETGPWDSCELSGIDFICTPYAQQTDLSANGADAVLFVEATVNASWTGAGRIAGTYGWDVSCEGDDCQDVSDSGNFGVVPCTMSQAFSGALK